MAHLKPGLTNEMAFIVGAANTAAADFYELLPDLEMPEVWSTSAMVTALEMTCAALVSPFLDDGEGTVGGHVDVAHVAPTPVGMTVTVSAKLTEVDGRKLTFSIEVRDEVESCGGGVHVRYIINHERFNLKASEKTSGGGN